MLDEFLTSERTEMRLARSVVQGLLSVTIVAVPLVLGGVIEDATQASLATAAIMCVLSPLMAMMRTGNPEDGTVEADAPKDGE